MDITEKVSVRNKFTYSIGGIGRDMLYTLVNMYLIIYFSYYVGLDKGELIGISIVMIITRIWDAINDPIMVSSSKTPEANTANLNLGF